MHFVRDITWSAVVALAILAVAGPSASATTAITVDKSDSATPCVSMASGGCKVHSEGEIALKFHFFGFEVLEARCHVEHRGSTDSNASGQITAQTITPGKHDTDCSDATAPPCPGSLPWPGSAEKDADGRVRAHFDVCIAPGERAGMNPSTCSGELITEVTETGVIGAEVQTHAATDVQVGFCELDISSSSEAGSPEGEVSHINQI
jgi:hypothetical protein